MGDFLGLLTITGAVLGQVQASSQMGQIVASRSNATTELVGLEADLLVLLLLEGDFLLFLLGIAGDGLGVAAVAGGLLDFLLTVITGSKIIKKSQFFTFYTLNLDGFAGRLGIGI